ncbi:branched-chain amino acid ABC transporter permease [Proteiniclasticum sp. BAD-10]|uniref:Branched-chain amino acid ABC transporter permease n=1 Tax=Proteiniclasticum sediminis TaxID=2804028 RepID=A0A941CS62_9CLOT|nr:branched-chain amino acid ABC transporter permease [Proteiniclasticum sediminis]MBR0576381.1 branched-chain amino acid ABC transporter permease [Proteiniclasticum sediminis]
MSTFLQIILRSLETGSIYALAALGIIIIYRTSNTTNFAQGAVAMFNTFVVTYLFNRFGLPLWVAVMGGIFSAIVTGFLIDVMILRHTKKVSPVAKQIITLGLIMIVVGMAPIFFGVDPLRLPRLIESGDLNLLGASISYNGLFNIALGLAIMMLLFYVLQKTKWGLAVRTTASNEYVARLMGVPTKNVTMAAWGVAGILGVIAGVMTAPMTSVTLNLMDEVQITALVACVLGGFQTFHGPVIGAYIMGIMRNLLLFYGSSVWGGQILYILILIFIVFRPYGLIGKKVVKKV